MSDMMSKTVQPCYEKSKEIISLELSTFLHLIFSISFPVKNGGQKKNLPIFLANFQFFAKIFGKFFFECHEKICQYFWQKNENLPKILANFFSLV